MSFSLEKLFVDVFAPQNGDIVTIMYDLPHNDIHDTQEWVDRRQMAEEWHQEIAQFSWNYGLEINPIIKYDATGVHNSDLPDYGVREGKRVRLDDLARDSTIFISMPQFSASAPLITFTKKFPNLRVASLPTVNRMMQETGLSADYDQIAKTCAMLALLFNQADGIEVIFSTGHSCYFDISDHKLVIQDNGRLHPGEGKDDFRFRNLPSGEVCTTPNESESSKTQGEIPVRYEDESAIMIVKNNRIRDVIGTGPITAEKRALFQGEKALRNIAEVAIGCNDKAVVTGNILQDEKAGFHWAYGRSDQLGGTIGPKYFSALNKVSHQDIVYAKGNPIICKRLSFIFSDGMRQTVIREGVLNITDEA
jgi:hypothetical protein